MASNVIHLPIGPRQEPHEPAPLGFFVRVGYNDHREVLDLVASGERGICGLVIDAQDVTRHRELIGEAAHKGLHLILDPKTQPMALPGGHSQALAVLPWGVSRCH